MTVTVKDALQFTVESNFSITCIIMLKDFFQRNQMSITQIVKNLLAQDYIPQCEYQPRKCLVHDWEKKKREKISGKS